jgi:hypothetical protein
MVVTGWRFARVPNRAMNAKSGRRGKEYGMAL